MWSAQIAISTFNRALVDPVPVSAGLSYVVDRLLRVVEDLGVNDGVQHGNRYLYERAGGLRGEVATKQRYS